MVEGIHKGALYGIYFNLSLNVVDSFLRFNSGEFLLELFSLQIDHGENLFKYIENIAPEVKTSELRRLVQGDINGSAIESWIKEKGIERRVVFDTRAPEKRG
jgi:hypothetical protein